MSVTLELLPVGFLFNFVNAIRQTHLQNKDLELKIKALAYANDGFVSEKDLQEICKEFETVFMDKDLLIKTLEEHGATDFEILGDDISCTMDVFKLSFVKIQEEVENKGAYKMQISANCSDEEICSLVNEIDEEYKMNTQEETYIKIKERLENKGMKINQEEVLEDNSIMLTVNIN